MKITMKKSTLKSNHKTLSELQTADTKEIRGGIGNPIKRYGVGTVTFTFYKTDLLWKNVLINME